ncbi:hypothetical protein V8E53_010983 [Lactarius tabidus]
MERIKDSTHENTPLMYQGIVQLCMSKLNDSTLEDHKQWILAIASGWVKHVASLQYELVAERLYKLKGFTNEDIMWSIVLLQLGGAHMAQFAHQLLALPSLMTIRCQTVLPALLISPSTPTVTEVEANIVSNLALEGMHLAQNSGNNQTRLELNILCNVIQNKEVHLATEDTVAAISVLSSEPQEYTVQPILFSGTCKKETSEQHACNKHNKRNQVSYCTVCIASDSDAKLGDALIIQTMTSELSPSSPIFALLRPLEFLNLLVGPDDITVDKDFKHLIKRQQNIFMCSKGIEIMGFCITPAVLCSQLEFNGISPHHMCSLLNPNNKQDVVLTYSLLREIWSLPAPPATCDPTFALACRTLNIYGEFARHLMLLYVCIDQNLNEQLIHLSAAAHLMFLLYHHNHAGTHFMPRQSYLDIILMVKNAYFCVIKMKIDNLTGNFYLVLLRTDQLETFFGLICTAVGTDAIIDMLQLGSCASGLTESSATVVTILAEHPELDYGMHHLSLPVFSKETSEFTSKADHINPKDWHSNVSISNVNLHTCWLLGRKQAEDLIPDAEASLNTLTSTNPGIDMLSPFSKLMWTPLLITYEQTDMASSEVSSHNEGHLRPQLTPYTHKGDIEDAIADEAPHNNSTSEILVVLRAVSHKGIAE